MRYVALIYEAEQDPSTVAPEVWGQVIDAYNAFGEESQAAGVNESGAALEPTQTATSVRVRDGKTLTTDGPFAETKEALGGFYILKADDLDEAISWAAKIPGAQTGTVEVRPVMEFDEDGQPVAGEGATA